PTGHLTNTWSMCWQNGGTATMTGTEGLNPTVTFSAPGFYSACLDADDGEFVSESYVDILVEPANSTYVPPLVDAGPDQTILLPDRATLNGSATWDGPPDGLFYWWQQASGPAPVRFDPDPARPNPVITFPSPGIYRMRLTVYD